MREKKEETTFKNGVDWQCLPILANDATIRIRRANAMDTDTMNIALPRNLKEYVQEQVSLGGYSSVSEYLRELIRADQKIKAKDALEAEILKGLSSGDATAMTAKDWQDIKKEVTRRHSVKKNGTR